MNLAELGRRAVACPRWRWMPGMRLLVGPGRAPYRYVTHEYAPPEGEDVGFSDPIVPDLSDPATLGGLLALVREAWKENVSPTYWPEDGGDPAYWAIEIDRWYDGDTEGASLVAALEAAP